MCHLFRNDIDLLIRKSAVFTAITYWMFSGLKTKTYARLLFSRFRILLHLCRNHWKYIITSTFLVFKMYDRNVQAYANSGAHDVNPKDVRSDKRK